MGGRTDGRTYVRTENLPILQDFVPYRAQKGQFGALKVQARANLGLHLATLGHQWANMWLCQANLGLQRITQSSNLARKWLKRASTSRKWDNWWLNKSTGGSNVLIGAPN